MANSYYNPGYREIPFVQANYFLLSQSYSMNHLSSRLVSSIRPLNRWHMEEGVLRFYVSLGMIAGLTTAGPQLLDTDT